MISEAHRTTSIASELAVIRNFLTKTESKLIITMNNAALCNYIAVTKLKPVKLEPKIKDWVGLGDSWQEMTVHVWNLIWVLRTLSNLEIRIKFDCQHLHIENHSWLSGFL
jgi:hypothetical protein